MIQDVICSDRGGDQGDALEVPVKRRIEVSVRATSKVWAPALVGLLLGQDL
jgi:hypothetical protein